MLGAIPQTRKSPQQEPGASGERRMLFEPAQQASSVAAMHCFCSPSIGKILGTAAGKRGKGDYRGMGD
jgi:hypothetical protein